MIAQRMLPNIARWAVVAGLSLGLAAGVCAAGAVAPALADGADAQVAATADASQESAGTDAQADATDQGAAAQPADAAASDAAALDAQTTAQPSSSASSGSTLADDLALASGTQVGSRLDLRELGVVTSQKNQSPWNTCWSFASIAASETSILSEAKAQGIDLPDIDLSELAVSALVFARGGVPASVAGDAQAGEGYQSDSQDVNDGLGMGGSFTLVSSAFAAGIGPSLESQAPYQNKQGSVTWVVRGLDVDGEPADFTIDNPTDESIAEWRAQGALCYKAYYSGNFQELDTSTGNSHLVYGDWSVDESLWQESVFEFAGSNALPNTRVMENGEYKGLNQAGVDAVKSELNRGRAVAVALHADQTTPSDVSSSVYLNTETWAQYTYDDDAAMNHGATIVGYDDSFSRTNFSDGVNNLPEGDGAWLVKNTFGSETEDFPNGQYAGWGLTDADGNHTGYYWVSYYDKSITSLVSFDFDLSIQNVGASTGRIIDQYDYMPVNAITGATFKDPVSGANIFTASQDMAVRALWCVTIAPKTEVTFDVYLLDDEAATPTDAEHARKVYSTTETYDYAGYHRAKIADESDWICLREGQRYSVVVTERYQGDDGTWLYTQPASFNVAVTEQYSYEGEDLVTYNAGFAAKVNPGESWTTATVDAWVNDETEGDFTSWTDWSDVVAGVGEQNPTVAFDNQPIKAYAQAQDWASVEELGQLEDAVASARELLAGVAVSEDGSGVAAGSQWVAQADLDALQAKVDAAQGVLELAGDFRAETSMTTPSSDEVSEQLAALEGLEADLSAVAHTSGE